MIRNYFYLSRMSAELSELLSGMKLTEAWSQEKDRLVLCFENDSESRFIELSVNPGNAYIELRKELKRAKRNSISFFESFLPDTLEDISIAVNDRTIKFRLKNSELFFAIRGKYTNSVLISGNEFHSFKKYEDDYIDSVKREMSETNFTTAIALPDLSNVNESISTDELRKSFPYFGKEIFTELKLRTGSEKSSSIISTLRGVITEAITADPVVLIDPKSFTVYLLPETFSKPEHVKAYKTDSVIEGISLFLRKQDSYKNLQKKMKAIEKQLDKEFLSLTNKLSNLKSVMESENVEEKYKRIASLLLINLEQVKKGLKKVKLPDVYEDNKEIEIKLNPDLSPKQNADRYFEKSRDDRIKRQKAEELYSKEQLKFEKLKKIKEEIEEGEPDTEKIMKELKLKTDTRMERQDQQKFRFREYLVDGKYKVYVGRDSQNNDVLTTKFAKQNDYWFHARSVSGSHVVLRVDNLKEAVPKSVLKKAASLAAFYSKAKTAGVVPVAYTLKKYVVKKKGMGPGTVALMKEDVLLVKPEIPDGCEQVEQE